jgi:hypothetical protein
MTRREQLYPEIKRLREVEGLKWREIGERLGLARSTVQDYYADPDNSKHMERHRRWQEKDRVAGRCSRCPAPISGKQVKVGGSLCLACWRAEQSRGKRERMDDIAQLWNEGATVEEIKAYMGYGPSSTPPILSEMMALGLIEARREGYRRKHEARRAA